MDNDIIKCYQQSIKSMEQVLLAKQATLRMLTWKYQPQGLWIHGTELLEVQAEVTALVAKVATKKKHLKAAKLAAMQCKGFLAGEPDGELF
jgi:hypothetical protein